ncbi:large ribosomal subunit protein uL30m isoform X1 [Lagenorhynchus albirostris]|uniref:large ribosomal subunit protein uL30m isoform X1 n=2 Tax=Lagenorhynchus albirostris TaxID=27610 RepID=UPI0028E93B6C|nr:large ribosomal subunit protein uL30m isoform X1 [Lagenorhynchus albirostris]
MWSPASWSSRTEPPRLGSLAGKGIQPQRRTVTTLMAGILRSIVQRPPGRLQMVTKGVEPLVCTDWIRHKFTKSRIPDKVFQPSPEDHEKYGGDPQQPHKLHIVTRIKSTKRRPYWEKDIIKMLGLQKAHTPQVHKNIPSVNAKLKVVKHLIRIKPLKLPQGLPREEDMSSTCLKSTGELVVGWLQNPTDQEVNKP